MNPSLSFIDHSSNHTKLLDLVKPDADTSLSNQKSKQLGQNKKFSLKISSSGYQSNSIGQQKPDSSKSPILSARKTQTQLPDCSTNTTPKQV